MMRQVVAINWRYIGDTIPAFVTIVFIPFANSVAYGLIAYVPRYGPCSQVYLTTSTDLKPVSEASWSTPFSTVSFI